MTNKDLIKYGFKKTNMPGFMPYEKHLSEPDEYGGRITIIITLERNTPEFALLLPDGSQLFLQVKNLDELKVFENTIQSWEPNY